MRVRVRSRAPAAALMHTALLATAALITAALGVTVAASSARVGRSVAGTLAVYLRPRSKRAMSRAHIACTQ